MSQALFKIINIASGSDDDFFNSGNKKFNTSDSSSEKSDQEIKNKPEQNIRILVLEDDKNVRSIVVQTLREQNYQVVEAERGEEALQMIQKEGNIDLLFTDIVLPGGMNGVEVAEKARRLLPSIKVLFTSGYLHGATIPGGESGSDEALLTKPYRQIKLISMVKDLIDK